MKKLSIFLYIMLITLFACEKDETMVKLNADPKPAVITSTVTDLNPTINEEVLKNEFQIKWNKADYGVTTEVKYLLQLDYKCGTFENPITLGVSTNNSLDITLENLNAKLVSDLNLAPHVPADLQLRIVSTINNNFTETSAPIAFTITPWSQWTEGLWLVSNAWSIDDAPAIYSLGEGVFDGYAYLSKDAAFTFANTPSTCDRTTYGGSNGTLSSDVSASGITVPVSGYYKIHADIEYLTYNLTLIETFGSIGTATPGGWGGSTALTYDPTSQVWESTLDLTSGALKFRANNDWAINYGPADGGVLEGTLELDNPGAISIAEDGNYTVTIDFSKTKSPNYTYVVKKNEGGVAPASLWLPGEYQGWNPSAAPTIKAINASTFDGYVYISAPTGYKFTSAPDWDHINYGDAGTPGVLTTDGLAGGLGLSEAGYYKFNVNVNSLTYSAVLINTIGMIGTSTPGGWDSSTGMTYDQANDVWKGTLNLVPGALKFRANNAWTINYGPADGGALEGTLIFDDPGAINITEAGNYTVIVDFSKSESPYKYSYSVVKN